MNEPSKLIALVFLCALSAELPARSAAERGYTAGHLLSPCQEADNDARWGAAAETECEQYILGFVDALAKMEMTGAGKTACPPELNTADEVRWAFMRWVHLDYTPRRAMPAPDALMETLTSTFPCK